MVEQTPTTEAFDALMPEPVAYRDRYDHSDLYLRSGIDREPLHTADQLRTAMQAVWDAATERAAKLCDEQGDFYMQQAREGDQSGASDHKACAAVECADAIRRSP